jgi:LacI family transcriptional regulator
MRAPTPARTATIADVARLAGVSMMTVSRVINNKGAVKDSTRARVETAMRQLSYTPNILARGLVNGRSGMLGVVTFDTAQYGPSAALLGIERAARDRGYGVGIVALPRMDRESLTAALDSLAHRSAEGAIVIAPHLSAATALAEMSTPLPVVCAEAGARGAAPVVAVDQRTGARLATEHLLQLGHQTVWHVAGPQGWYETVERIEGWREALTTAGVAAPPLLRGDWSAASGYAVAQDVLDTGTASAVFLANDQMALGFMHALFEQGMTAPDPVSIVGFDDIPEAAYFSPGLTTVRQDFDELGRRAVEMLIEVLGDDTPEEDRVDLIPSELVVRASSGPPAG